MRWTCGLRKTCDGCLHINVEMDVYKTIEMDGDLVPEDVEPYNSI